MNTQIKVHILQKIREYNKIIICRHKRPDGDAIGSTKGLWSMLKLSFPEKEIYLDNEDSSEYLSFLGDEGNSPDPSVYPDSLFIALDCGNIERLSNSHIYEARELIKIDHHVDITPYGDISWVEEERSSVSEMIADFWYTFRDELKMNSETAKYLYTGMVTDSGRFKFDSVKGDTLRLAGALLDYGIDTENLFANLYLDDFDYLKFKAYLYKKMQITENGVVYLYITKAMQKRFNLSSETASATVSMMDSIKGCICWIAFIENKDKSIRVRLRSRFMTVNKLAEQYHGGGHERAAGATVYSLDEANELIAKADKLTKEYKENNEGWL